MDVNRLSTGEKIAGVSGILLLLFMFIFSWFTVEGTGDFGGLNAWESFAFIDFVLFLTCIAGIALAISAASQSDVDLPVALSAITAGLGILSVILILFRIIVTPGFDIPFGGDVDTDRSIGVFLGLIAAAGIAYGGWRAMQEEGSSFSGPADRRTAPPPPPPPAAPPPGGTGGPAA